MPNKPRDMIKYVPEMTSVVIEEIPDEVTLAVDISECQGNCVGCHSPFLKESVGEELTESVIDRLAADNYGLTCFLFLGEGRDYPTLLSLAEHVRSLGLKPALYSGRVEVEDEFFDVFDYVKVGPYLSEYGPLDSRTTNQRLYAVSRGADGKRTLSDITYRFWRKGIDPNVNR